MARLDSAVGLLTVAAGERHPPFQVAVMVPYPDPKADTLQFGDSRFDLGTVAGRAAAVKAYIQEALRRFKGRVYPHLALTGFYWLNESIHAPDSALVGEVSAEVHLRRKSLFWIPYYRASGFQLWRSFGFDQAWLQPNYFFHPEVPAVRIDSAFTFARNLGMGVELEFDKRMFRSAAFSDRLEPYLAALEAAPDLRARSIAIYEGQGALLELARSRDESYRALYNRLVAALRRPSTALPPK